MMMNRGVFKVNFKNLLRSLISPDYIMSYLKSMRKVNYYKYLIKESSTHKLIVYIRLAYNIWKFKRLGAKLGFSIGDNVFGYGLVVPHYGTIVVGESNKIGNYCVLHTDTCISSNGKTIGDGLYLSTGAKITSKINLGNNISIGANSVVNKSFEDNNIMIAGAPAKYIKNKESWYTLDSTYMLRRESVESLKRKLIID